jgi:uncharacterized protein YtpQ (UPF0354 family)
MTTNDELNRPALKREQLFSLYERVVRERFAGIRTKFLLADQLEVETADKRTFTIHLENLWRQSQGSTEIRSEIVERHLAALENLINQSQQPQVTRENIVPTIKDSEYLALFGKNTSVAREHLVADLWIVYAVDLPTAIKTLSISDLHELDITQAELRELAVENMRRLLPEIQQHGSGPWYLLTAGGDYTASLLLLETIWERLQESVEGNVVAAVPSRDVLLFTGDASSEGVQAVRQRVREIHEDGDHVISQTLLRRISGNWETLA